jgi:hypothetical protein
MRSISLFFVLAAALITFGPHPSNAQSLVDDVTNACKTEIQTHCADVTPGQQRILACLYAHNDKLSNKCEFGLYDAAVRLERAVAALTYVAKSCDDDIEKVCPGVEIGEGRIATCLNQNKDKISNTCTQALTDVGLME